MTAVRWARLLRGLGHQVRIEEQYTGGACDVLIALHARRSQPSMERFRAEHPGRPLVLALTGTDLYRDIHEDPSARQALEWADRLVTLQPKGIEELPEPLRPKARSILQSAAPPRRLLKPRRDVFEVCVLGHLREVKDPFRAAEAAKRLPAESKLHVLHIGGALSADMAKRARAEARRNPRYTWVGEVPRGRALQLLSRCRLLVLTSWMEGGANAITEALVCGVPAVSSRISGSIGLLGEDYPGFFEPGDTQGLAELLRRSEVDKRFYARLASRCQRLARTVTPRREQAAWARLLAELAPRARPAGKRP